ncbi:unnamed protein product [Rotaria sp. Silwood2]|nr:unnamed protein product [Rotaria sp. Silwood2]CAF3091514.1 unnamed protein product [Rotaria sp. Silwood2]CAF3354564.1 unnamed protein product [Rotaria sp. Silwood2]CAF4315640.1 unnamed protein product [Rotaria sp. Silwood2]CAF4440019.1 unnamed protein product [Rotaria sp. Silwood2]
MQDVEKISEMSLAQPRRALLNVKDYHQQAKRTLPQMIYDFYSTGSDDQLTLIDNQQAFLNPVSCQTQLLNSTITISFPCIIAPTALHRLANNEHGELATVRAAVACSTIMCVSTMASICMERVAEEHREQIRANYPRSTSQLWYQLYVFKNRQYT